jgi:hypothetical protein
MTIWVLGIGLKVVQVYWTHGATTVYVSAKKGRSNNLIKTGARVLINFGSPLATKLTYKMR